jgi:hypothetical protein
MDNSLFDLSGRDSMRTRLQDEFRKGSDLSCGQGVIPTLLGTAQRMTGTRERLLNLHSLRSLENDDRRSDLRGTQGDTTYFERH